MSVESGCSSGALSTGAAGGTLFANDFVPRHEVDCIVWNEADRGVTVVSGNVSQWADQSGAGNTVIQSNATKRPAFTASGINGLPSVTPDGVNDVLVMGGNISAAPLTVFAVAQATDAASINRSLCGITGAVLYSQSPSAGISWFGSGGNVNVATDTTAAHVYGVIAAGASGKIIVDGTATTKTIAAESVAPWGCCGNDSFGLYWDGPISLVVAFKVVLGAPGIARMNEYAGRKYGITMS